MIGDARMKTGIQSSILATLVAGLLVVGCSKKQTEPQQAAADTNTAPVADNKTASTPANTPITITLSASDVDGDTLTFSRVSPPSHGSLGPIGTVSCTTSSGSSSGRT